MDVSWVDSAFNLSMNGMFAENDDSATYVPYVENLICCIITVLLPSLFTPIF